MAKLAFDVCRCVGIGCPEKDDCLRHTDKGEGAYRLSFAATMRKENEQLCDYFIWNEEDAE